MSDFEVSDFDYVVMRGEYYEVAQDDFGGESYLRKVDGIPDKYSERWDDAE